MVEVVQDRVQVERRTRRSRLVEAVESALHLGKGQVDLVDADGRSGGVLRTAGIARTATWTLPPPAPGLFSLQQPARRLPGLPRLRADDRDRPASGRLPDRSLSIAEGVVKAFQGETVLGMPGRPDARCASARGVDVDAPFDGLCPARPGVGSRHGRRRRSGGGLAAQGFGTGCRGSSTGWSRGPTRCTCGSS